MPETKIEPVGFPSNDTGRRSESEKQIFSGSQVLSANTVQDLTPMRLRYAGRFMSLGSFHDLEFKSLSFSHATSALLRVVSCDLSLMKKDICSGGVAIHEAPSLFRSHHSTAPSTRFKRGGIFVLAGLTISSSLELLSLRDYKLLWSTSTSADFPHTDRTTP